MHCCYQWIAILAVRRDCGANPFSERRHVGEFEVGCRPVRPALARAVYYTSREGQEVRDDLYQAIAAVLAFVFGLSAKGAPPPAKKSSAIFSPGRMAILRPIAS